MNYKKLFILVLLALSFSNYAQSRYFFYVRYDPREGNAAAVVGEIDRIARRNPTQLLVMLSGGSEPQIADASQWNELRQVILTQQNSPVVYSDIEQRLLNEFFSRQMKEQVRFDGDRMAISGEYDADWTISFVLSESAYGRREDYEIVPLEFSLINQLRERGMNVRWYSFNDSTMLEERDAPKHPFYDDEMKTF